MAVVLSEQKRPLSTLTREECQALYTVAFGYAVPLEQLQIFALVGPLTIRFDERALVIYPDGQMMASNRQGNFNDTAVCFNAYKVVGLLAHYSIHLGGYLPQDPQS